MTRCCFCGADPQGAELLSRRIGWENECFFVTPTVGEITADHLLLIPWAHVPSFAHLPSDHAREGEGIVREHCALLSNESSKVVVFEHGMASHSASGGCGISHAHIHMVSVPRAVSIDPLPEPDDLHPWIPVPAGECLRSAEKGSGYLLIGCEGEFWRRQVENLPSQYLRRWIAELVDRPEWNWRKAEETSLAPRARQLRLRHTAKKLGAAII